ncbi:MAG TPA: radical SAM protein [Anaerolineae bacterium]|nr:radical SAM protein [Anaerolineae bacterium]
MIVFGPVPSRRLGRSLGINNIPPKICTYACAYCQLGRTLRLQAVREAFYDPGRVTCAVRTKVTMAQERGEAIDYLTFVPDGEPTLDIHLRREIELLRPLGLPIAVITNGSLIWRWDVRQDLMSADWVSVKVDSVQEEAWRRIDRPHGSLALDSILRGVEAFARDYRGILVTETMLVAGINDGDEQIEKTADFVSRLRPDRAYLSIPNRPPAEAWARVPDEQALHRAFCTFQERVEQVEYLIGYEGNDFSFTGDVERDLLSITSVHPMREDAVGEYLTRAGEGWPVVRRMVAQGKLTELEHGGHMFYLRTLRAEFRQET